MRTSLCTFVVRFDCLCQVEQKNPIEDAFWIKFIYICQTIRFSKSLWKSFRTLHVLLYIPLAAIFLLKNLHLDKQLFLATKNANITTFFSNRFLRSECEWDLIWLTKSGVYHVFYDTLVLIQNWLIFTQLRESQVKCLWCSVKVSVNLSALFHNKCSEHFLGAPVGTVVPKQQHRRHLKVPVPIPNLQPYLKSVLGM